MRRGLTLFIVVLLAIDCFSKWFVHSYLPLMSESSPVYPYGGIGIFQNFLGIGFAITHLTNTGMVWGMLSGSRFPLLIVRMIVIVGLLFYVFVKRPRFTVSLPMALVVAGALGNVLDALFYGHVVDMFFFRFWGYSYPVFNLADSFIFIGVFWLLGLSFKKKHAKLTH